MMTLNKKKKAILSDNMQNDSNKSDVKKINAIILLRSFLFSCFLILWTVFCCVLGSITFITRRQTIIAYVAFGWSVGIIKMLKLCCGITHEIEGDENLPLNQGYIVACKHQSAWETIFFLYHLWNPAYVLKRELCFIPIFGWYFPRLRMVIINRKDGTLALKNMVKAAKNIIASGKRPLVIFPEGTRVAVGEQPQCKAGIAALHEALPQVPIVPIAVNSGEYWPARAYLKFPGIIKVRIHKAIVQTGERAAFLAEVRDKINLLE